MNKFYILISAFFFSITLFGQKDTLSIPINYKAKWYKNKEAVVISNRKNGEMVVLIEDKKETILRQIDKNENLLDELRTVRIDSNFPNFLGNHYFEDGTYAIIFSDKTKTSFSALKFNFKTKKIEQVSLDFSFKKEKHIESITHDNTFYIFTASKGRSHDVNFYKLNQNNTFNKNTVSFEFISTNVNGLKRYPIHILAARMFSSGSLTKIDSYSPNSIQTTSGVNKLYQLENELIFSFDKDPKVTKLIHLNLNDFSLKTVKFAKPALDDASETFFSQNSYIHNNIIYQLIVSSKQMKFTATDMETKSVLKDINLRQKDSITFKNGPIILEKTGEAAMFSVKERKLEKTSKFLRKVSVSKTGVTALEIEDQLQLTIGGFVEIKRSSTLGAMNFGAIGATAFILGNVAFNPTYAAYNSYGSTKSTFINCIFDKEYNHVNGKVKSNVFDDIKSYEEYFEKQQLVGGEQADGSKYNTSASMKLKNVFYHNGDHYFGYLNTNDRNYHLVKF